MKPEIRMKAGDTLVITIPASNEDGDVLDLVGASVDWWLARDSAALEADVVLKKALGSGVTAVLVDPDNPKIEVRLDPADTAGLKGPYYHEARVTTSANVVARIYWGVIRIERSLIPTV